MLQMCIQNYVFAMNDEQNIRIDKDERLKNLKQHKSQKYDFTSLGIKIHFDKMGPKNILIIAIMRKIIRENDGKKYG